MRIGLAAALAAVVAMTCAAPALGATVSLTGSVITYNAGAGFANNVTVSFSGGNFIVQDTGENIAAGPGCMGSGNTVTCPDNGIVDTFSGSLGDLGDTFNISAPLEVSSLLGGSGNDTMNGGALDAFLVGNEGNDTLNGTSAEDDLRGGEGEDTLHGGDGRDHLFGGDGNDIENGGGGNDGFGGGFSGQTDDGADVMSGGPGLDSMRYDTRVAGVTITKDGQANDGQAGENDNVPGDIEQFSLTQFADSFTGDDGLDSASGSAGNDAFLGLGGNDAYFAGDGDDRVEGGAGNDQLNGDNGGDLIDGGPGTDRMSTFSSGPPGDGPDVMNGGDGDDLVAYESFDGGGAQDPVTVTLDGAADDGLAGEGDNVAPDVENVSTGDGDDTLVGTDGPNNLDGGRGNDNIAGLGGGDALDGGAGNDTLDAGTGNDLLVGESGADLMRARDGAADELRCGSFDDLTFLDGADAPDPTCEVTNRGATVAASTARVDRRRRRARVPLSCPAAEGAPCRGTVELRSTEGILIGRGNFDISAGERRTVSARLTRAGRARLRRKRRLRVDAVVSGIDATGAPSGSDANLTLRRAR